MPRLVFITILLCQFGYKSLYGQSLKWVESFDAGSTSSFVYLGEWNDDIVLVTKGSSGLEGFIVWRINDSGSLVDSNFILSSSFSLPVYNVYIADSMLLMITKYGGGHVNLVGVDSDLELSFQKEVKASSGYSINASANFFDGQHERLYFLSDFASMDSLVFLELDILGNILTEVRSPNLSSVRTLMMQHLNDTLFVAAGSTVDYSDFEVIAYTKSGVELSNWPIEFDTAIGLSQLHDFEIKDSVFNFGLTYAEPGPGNKVTWLARTKSDGTVISEIQYDLGTAIYHEEYSAQRASKESLFGLMLVNQSMLEGDWHFVKLDASGVDTVQYNRGRAFREPAMSLDPSHKIVAGFGLDESEEFVCVFVDAENFFGSTEYKAPPSSLPLDPLLATPVALNFLGDFVIAINSADNDGRFMLLRVAHGMSTPAEAVEGFNSFGTEVKAYPNPIKPLQSIHIVSQELCKSEVLGIQIFDQQDLVVERENDQMTIYTDCTAKVELSGQLSFGLHYFRVHLAGGRTIAGSFIVAK